MSDSDIPIPESITEILSSTSSEFLYSNKSSFTVILSYALENLIELESKLIITC